MRLVKKTVNQDDVSAYHLFYADGLGSPGTDITFFDWPVGRERRGTHSIVRTGLRIKGEAAFKWWADHFKARGVSAEKVAERDGRLTLDFEDGGIFVQFLQQLRDATAKVGATTVRIFAGKLEAGDTLEAAQKRVVAAMNECCEVAEKLGVHLALENHGGITDTPEHLLELVKPVKSSALGVNIDTGNFHTADPYADIAKIAPYGVVSQVKTEVFPGNKREAADLGKVIKILKDANFHGYVALEYEAKEDAKVAVPKFVKELRKLISG